jgi:uncharacterized Zn finger protein (UPF0148 family)
MIQKHCSTCGQHTWHNLSGKKDGSPRCTYCGAPVTSNPAKREHQQGIIRQQIAKLGRLA